MPCRDPLKNYTEVRLDKSYARPAFKWVTTQQSVQMERGSVEVVVERCPGTACFVDPRKRVVPWGKSIGLSHAQEQILVLPTTRMILRPRRQRAVPPTPTRSSLWRLWRCKDVQQHAPSILSTTASTISFQHSTCRRTATLLSHVIQNHRALEPTLARRVTSIKNIAVKSTTATFPTTITALVTTTVVPGALSLASPPRVTLVSPVLAARRIQRTAHAA